MVATIEQLNHVVLQVLEFKKVNLPEFMKFLLKKEKKLLR